MVKYLTDQERLSPRTESIYLNAVIIQKGRPRLFRSSTSLFQHEAKTMKPPASLTRYITTFLLVLLFSRANSTTPPHSHSTANDPTIPLNNISFSTRAHWMRQANAALSSLTGTPCPFAAFSTMIVNHTDTDPSSLGSLVCMGANSNAKTGNPTLHGEIAAINNCSALLTDPAGEYRLSPTEALAAFRQLTLYTNAESCPMCASAIRWAGMREYVYGTSIESLTRMGWGQIDIGSAEVFERSKGLGGDTYLLGDVLANETDGYFGWQFDEARVCPEGCVRVEDMCRNTDGLSTVLHDGI
jgi:tRNA(Arg) A34 adenosine deaminase TadA